MFIGTGIAIWFTCRFFFEICEKQIEDYIDAGGDVEDISYLWSDLWGFGTLLGQILAIVGVVKFCYENLP